jgi:hypothetical protein
MCVEVKFEREGRDHWTVNRGEFRNALAEAAGEIHLPEVDDAMCLCAFDVPSVASLHGLAARRTLDFENDPNQADWIVGAKK